MRIIIYCKDCLYGVHTKEKKLYRSRKDKQLCDVCGGFAKYFDIDVTIIRVVMVLLVLFAGGGLVTYIICALVIPNEPEGIPEVKESTENKTESKTEDNSENK